MGRIRGRSLLVESRVLGGQSQGVRIAEDGAADIADRSGEPALVLPGSLSSLAYSEVLEHAPKLDPVVGGVPGIGPALFAYMRMRCGADALKPDLRVADALRNLGFESAGDPHSILVVARAAATELGVSLLVLDQLLWGRDG